MIGQTANTTETKSLLAVLKLSVQQELSKLPETLSKLEPAQRVNILCRLLPYVLPKAENIEVEDEGAINVTLNI